MKSQDPLEALLAQPLLIPPDNFADKVRQRLAYEPLPRKVTTVTTWLQWLALSSAIALGIEQVLGFILGVWLVSNAS